MNPTAKIPAATQMSSVRGENGIRSTFETRGGAGTTRTMRSAVPVFAAFPFGGATTGLASTFRG